MSRSLAICKPYLPQAKLALKRNGFHSQRALAETVGYSLSTVGNFLRGKPVDFATFSELCHQLNLDWQDISSVGEPEFTTNDSCVRKFHEEPAEIHSNSNHDWGEAIDVSTFYNRSSELKSIHQWITQDHIRIITILGMGGIGKTSLSIKVAQTLTSEFNIIIFRSLRNAPEPLFFFKTLLHAIAQSQDASPKITISEIFTSLLKHLQTQHCLLIFDNLESLLENQDRAGRYRPEYELYAQFLQLMGDINHNSCLMVTTRQKPMGLQSFEGDTLVARSLSLKGLHLKSGRKIFDQLGSFQASQKDWTQIIEQYAGNPLALKIVASYIRDCFAQDITQFLRIADKDPIIFDDIRDLLKQQIQRLSPTEFKIMIWLAINREPTSISTLQKDLIEPISLGELLQTLMALKNRSLIEPIGESYVLQPVLLEYMTTEIIQVMAESILSNQPEALVQYPLMKAQSPVSIRDIQNHFLIQPLVQHLLQKFNHSTTVAQHLYQMISKLQADHDSETGYACANFLHLAHAMGVRMKGYDFADLSIRQANLQGMILQDTNFAGARFQDSLFSEILDEVKVVKFSPNGQCLAIADKDGKVMLWSLSNGQRLWEGCEHTQPVNALVFSKNEGWIASVSSDQSLKLWDIRTGHCIHTWREETALNAIDISPDEQRIIIGGQNGSIIVRDIKSGDRLKVLSGHRESVMSIACHKNGDIAASGSADTTIKLWDIDRATCIQTIEGHQNWVTSLEFCPQGHQLASCSSDHRIKLWDISSGNCLKTLLGHQNWVLSLAFSSDGKHLVSGSGDQTVKLWDIQSGHCLKTFTGHTHAIFSVAFNPQATLIASGGLDQSIRIWDIDSGTCTKLLQGHTNRIFAVASSSDGVTIASGSFDHTIRLWDSHTAELMQTLLGHQQPIYGLAFHPEGQILASASGDCSIKLWHVPSGRCIRTLTGHHNWVYSVAFSPNGDNLVSGSGDHTIKIWQIKTGQVLKTLNGHQTWVWSVAYSPNGNMIASGSGDRTIKLWDVHTGDCIKTFKGHQDRVYSVAFSVDGKQVISGSFDHSIKVWDIKTGACIQTLAGHSNGIYSIDVHSDRNTVVSGSLDQTIKLWDLSTGQCITTLRGHQKEVRSVAFATSIKSSLDAQTRLISGSQDQTCRIWDLGDGSCNTVLRVRPLYENMNITGVSGLTVCQQKSLEHLGAVETYP